MSPQIAWFEVLAYNAEALYSGKTRSFVLLASCTILKNWGVVLNSIDPSLIVFDGGMLLNHPNSGDAFASFAK